MTKKELEREEIDCILGKLKISHDDLASMDENFQRLGLYYSKLELARFLYNLKIMSKSDRTQKLDLL